MPDKNCVVLMTYLSSLVVLVAVSKVLLDKERGSQARPASQDNMMLGQASPVAHLPKYKSHFKIVYNLEQLTTGTVAT